MSTNGIIDFLRADAWTVGGMKDRRIKILRKKVEVVKNFTDGDRQKSVQEIVHSARHSKPIGQLI